MTKYIIISGVDGSGKTTVIEGVRAQLEAEGKTVGYIWMRYHHKLIKIMHAIAKLTGLSKRRIPQWEKCGCTISIKSPFVLLVLLI